MKVKVIVEISADEMAEIRGDFYGDDWTNENVIFECINENYDYFMQDIEVKII